jgi:alpha-galactosidase
MKTLADEFREIGVRPGIWVRYLNDKDAQLPEGARRSTGALDPSHPAVLELVKEATKRIVDWGYELIKHDYSTYDLFGAWGFLRPGVFPSDGPALYDDSRTNAEVLVEFYRTILEATEGKALVLGCNCIGHLCAGLAHINRTGDDTSGKEWTRTRTFGVNTLAFRLPQHKAFYVADADCVGFIAGRIPWELNERWADALAHSGTPMFLSIPRGALNEEQFARMRELYAVASKQADVMEPLDWEYNALPAHFAINGEERCFDWYSDEENAATV